MTKFEQFMLKAMTLVVVAIVTIVAIDLGYALYKVFG
jgi:hypothetical protein